MKPKQISDLQAEVVSLHRDIDAGFQAVRDQRDQARAALARVEALAGRYDRWDAEANWTTANIGTRWPTALSFGTAANDIRTVLKGDARESDGPEREG